MKLYKRLSFIFLSFIIFSNAFAANKVVNLTVAYKTVYFAGCAKKAIAINNQIPGPTLHFKEGDHVIIHVCNHLKEPTTIHWHGILVPWQMDGVANVSQHAIPPGCAFRYEFTLHQSGTYWYHAHEALQEQIGLYGAFIIDPVKKPAYQYDKDYVIVLSDWSNTGPEQIMANLKKDGDYYASNFPLQASLMKFIHAYQKTCTCKARKQLINDYLSMQKMRMSLYDMSDVAYDRFLLNGTSCSMPWRGLVKPGDKVRLRFIGAGAGTIFHVKIPCTAMQMVHVQGNDVKPYAVNDFTIAPGETYDVLIKINEDHPYIIYAESIDTVGAAYGALVTSLNQYVNYWQVAPFPEPPPVTQSMMAMMMGEKITENADMHMKMNMSEHEHHQMSMPMDMTHQKHNHQMSMDHAMTMPTEPTIIGDRLSYPIPFTTSLNTKYHNCIAAVKTNDPNKPVYKTIRMELFGYMDRFIWFINGVPEYNAKPIILEPSKRYRIVFTNTSMMRHPMHIHGHWFILRKGQGAYDPLLHTIDVPLGATITADIDTDASGQWFFHCHLLYHMMAGMARVFQYDTLIAITQCKAQPKNIVHDTAYYNRPIVRVDEARPIDVDLVCHPMGHTNNIWFATFLELGADPFHHVQQLNYKGLYGFDYHKLELFINDAEVDQGSVDDADIDIFYWHLLSQFWAIKGGVNYFYRPAQKPYWQPGIGIEGLMPYFIDTDVRAYYYGGSAKFDFELSRDTQITNNFFIRLGLRSIAATKSVLQAQIGSGLNQMRYSFRPFYRVMPGLDIYAEYEYQKDYGAFKIFQAMDGESTTQNTITFGFVVIL